MLNLTLDVGLTPENPQKWLEKFKDQAESPYYQRLLHLNAEHESKLEMRHEVLTKKPEIEFGSLDLFVVEKEPHEIKFPVLLGKECS